MSFKVDWNLLETQSMSEWTKELLTEALNSGKRPNILASNIEIKDLNFGKIPPDFEILEIGELEKDRFRGIFKINYSGDSSITLHTKVQANPLKIYHDNLVELENDIGGSSNFVTPNFLLSNNEFSIPLDLKLSDIKINAIGIIVFSKTKGLTLVFRNDPLDSIKVSSTFDMVQVLANFLQKQIESQIRELFRETLPTVLHKLSLKYITLNNEFDTNLLQKLEKSINEEEEIVLFDLNNEFNNYSMKNLQHNLKLFNSRETLELKVPKFKKIIQRSNLDKFNKNLSPNLLTSLNLLNDYKLENNNSNGIPINLLVNKDYNNVKEIIKNISNIQTNNYYKTTNNNNNGIELKPKRRVIKLGKKNIEKPEKTEKSSPMLVSKASSMNTSMSRYKKVEDNDSEDNTLIEETDEIQQPKPLRSTDISPQNTILESNDVKDYHPHSHLYRNFSNSPLNNSITGVGIGNNYFNFNNKDTMSELEDSKQEFNDKINKLYQSKINELNEKFKVQPSFTLTNDTYLDFKTIKNRLNDLSKLEDKSYFDIPPPYQM